MSALMEATAPPSRRWTARHVFVQPASRSMAAAPAIRTIRPVRVADEARRGHASARGGR
jgi:hypothetical protein